MSEPRDESLDEELEQITARELASELTPPVLKEDDARLRESWLAFGRLLEMANHDFDEAALAANVRAVSQIPTSPARRSRSLARRIGITAIAASLLVAAIVWRMSDDRDRVARDSAAPSQHQDDPGGARLHNEPAFEEQYAWDDSLDQRISDASDQLIYAAADWRGYDTPYAAIDQRMQDLTEALGDDPL